MIRISFTININLLDLTFIFYNSRASFFSLRNKTCSLCLSNSSCTSIDVNARNFHPQTVHQNITVINKSRNWNILLFLEALAIENLQPFFNSELKASRELKLFE